MRNTGGQEGAFGSGKTGQSSVTADVDHVGFKSRWGQPNCQARLDATEERNPSTSAPLTGSDELKDSPGHGGESPRDHYHREYMRRWIAERRAAFFAGKSCALCGATENLELDHLDPAKKVSHRIWSWSDKRRGAEIAKCRVVCEPCHRTRHAEERRKPLVHGTRNAYKKRLCRCADCRAWNAQDVAACRARNALRLPPEPIGRTLIIAFCLAFLVGAACETNAQTVQRCRETCAPYAVQSFRGANGFCYCADRLADGGHL